MSVWYCRSLSELKDVEELLELPELEEERFCAAHTPPELTDEAGDPALVSRESHVWVWDGIRLTIVGIPPTRRDITM